MPEMTPLEARLTEENEALRRENARQAQEIRLLRGIDPFAYLRDVFTRMPQMAAKDYATLAPAAWDAARRPGGPEKKDRLHTKTSNLQRRCA
jgi:hypothetical protein